MKKSFSSCGPSLGKQIFQSFYLRRKNKQHSCNKKIHYSNAGTNKIDNSIIFSRGKFYKIIDVNVDMSEFKCHQYIVSNFICPISNINFSDCLAFKIDTIICDDKIVKLSDIEGKAVMVKGYLLFAPINVLLEQQH